MITTKTKHDRGVLTYGRYFVRTGWVFVRSHLPRHIRPPMIMGRIPDVYARHGLYEVIVEVETQKSYNSIHSRLQRRAFRAWANVAPAYRKFYVRIV